MAVEHRRFEYEVTVDIPANTDFDLTMGGAIPNAEVAYISVNDLVNHYDISVDGVDRTIGPDDSKEIYPGSSSTTIRFAFDLEGAAYPVQIIVKRIGVEQSPYVFDINAKIPVLSI